MRVLRCVLSSVVFCLGVQIPSAEARPIVLELFTSQGCSSCPPADALLSSLANRRDLLPLAFHVTYWNALGWRDPFSSETATARQAAYAAQLGGGSYTPELVVDGRSAVVGSDREAVVTAIAEAGRGPDVPIRVSVRGAQLSISLGAGTGRGRILLVGYDPRHQTQVGRGENGGRLLSESNIVRSLQVIGDYDGRLQSLEIVRGIGSDAAVLVQAPDLRIIGAARL